MRNRDNYYYRSLGASGAVSAVVFAFIFLDPLQKLGLVFIPIYLPGFIFGVIYLVVSTFLDRKGGGNINHSAHIWGALYGITFLIVFGNAFGQYKPLQEFIDQVRYYFSSF
jgi:membrane associated rhomboid family serine protease